MTKQDLVQLVAAKTGYTQKQVKEVLEEIFSSILEATMFDDEEVMLRGFGAFHMVEGKPRIGRNVKLNTPLKIPAKKRLKFRSFVD